MRVWMMNPKGLPLGRPSAVVISNEKEDLLFEVPVAVVESRGAWGSECTIEETVRFYEEVGFVRVVPAEEARYILHITAPDGRFLYDLNGYPIRGDGHGCTPVSIDHARKTASQIKEIAEARGVDCRVFFVLCE